MVTPRGEVASQAGPGGWHHMGDNVNRGDLFSVYLNGVNDDHLRHWFLPKRSIPEKRLRSCPRQSREYAALYPLPDMTMFFPKKVMN